MRAEVRHPALRNEGPLSDRDVETVDAHWLPLVASTIHVPHLYT